MKESILIQQFGPITKAEVAIKDINIFIGTTSSGKSTVAKLISIFQTLVSRSTLSFRDFTKLLADYNIDFRIAPDTLIRYQRDQLSIELNGKNITFQGSVEKSSSVLAPIYIPAERVFFSTISQSIFGLMSSNISLPKWIIDFGARFEQARNSLKKLPVDFLKADYEYDDSTDYIQLRNSIKIKLSQASSGLQSVIPLLLVIGFNTERKQKEKNFFVIEEPELNLYPSSQKDLVEFILGKINDSGDKLIITTHSPYLLTAIDNLIQAHNVTADHPAMKDKVARLVPEKYWIDYNKVSCYYFDEGSGRSTMDRENKSIGPSNIDNVSERLSETFEELLTLKYPG